jgi:hypothetical protein
MVMIAAEHINAAQEMVVETSGLAKAPLVLKTKQLLSIRYGKTKDDFFIDIEDIKLHQNKLYILDSKKHAVTVFDQNGKFINTFGKNGEGPGEFQYPGDLILTEKFIYITDGYQIHQFNYAGQFLKKFKTTEYCYDMAVFDTDMIYTCQTYEETQRYSEMFHISMQDGAKRSMARFPVATTVQRSNNGKQMTFQVFHDYLPQMIITAQKDIVWAGFNQNYEISKYSISGDCLLTIKNKEAAKPITAREKEWIYNQFAPKHEKIWSKGVLKEAVQFPAYRPFFKVMLLDDRGLLYVQRQGSVLDKQPENLFDVYDSNGKYIGRLTMPINPQIIDQGCIYAKEEDQDEEIAISKYHIVNFSEFENWVKTNNEK